MGIVERIKNALFEVEYVEVDKEDKKVKKKEETEKPIAKRIILSKPKVENKEDRKDFVAEKIEEVNQSSLDVSSVELRENKTVDFKIMDDNDFKVDTEVITDTKEVIEIPVKQSESNSSIFYQKEEREKAPYGIDVSNQNLVQEYGKAYEKREEKPVFRPSPIISPIYGVLDKNYRKEDVKEKRNSSYTREKVNFDDIRDKAYGHKKEVIEDNNDDKLDNVEVESEDDDNLLVDLTRDNDKPAIKEVTMGDAIEYFNDLGLEYNVDYRDASKEKATGRRLDNTVDAGPELFSITDRKLDKLSEEKVSSDVPRQRTDIDVENDDNLFDLIDSMYDEDK